MLAPLTEGILGIGSLLVGLVPLAIPTLWSISLLWGGAVGWHVIAAAGYLVVAAGAVSVEVAVAFSSYIACGLGMGWALARRWRHDAVLGLALLPLLMVTWWAAAQLSYEQLITETGQDLVTALQQSLPGGEEAATQAAQMEVYEEHLAATLDLLVRIWPGLLCLGLVAHVGLVLLLVRGLVRWRGRSIDLRSVPPFHQWRLPFYLVWILAAGLALMIVRGDAPTRIGLNTILVAVTLLSVQGLAVQINLAGRVLPPWLRIVFWTVVAIFFAPLVLIGSVLVGLVDQWLDLRRLGAVPDR
jgi:uncharacterized protein YybS (DUF2232 family)